MLQKLIVQMEDRMVENDRDAFKEKME